MSKISIHKFSLPSGRRRGFYFLYLTLFLLCSCDSGDIAEQIHNTTDSGRTVKLTGTFVGIDSWDSKYAVSLAGFSTGNNYAQVVRTIPNTTSDNTKVELIQSNISNDINTIELAITNRLRERIITLASVNLDDYTDKKDTIHLDVGTIDVSRFGSLQIGLFDKACIQCHGGNGGAGAASLNLTRNNAYAQLVNKASTRKEGMMRVVSGNPQQSLIHQLLSEGGENLLHVNHTEILSNQFKENTNEVRLLLDEWINGLEAPSDSPEGGVNVEN